MRWFGSWGSKAPDAMGRRVVRPAAGALGAAAMLAAAPGPVVDAARVTADAARSRLYRLTECAPPALSAAWLDPSAPSRRP